MQISHQNNKNLKKNSQEITNILPGVLYFWPAINEFGKMYDILNMGGRKSSQLNDDAFCQKNSLRAARLYQ